MLLGTLSEYSWPTLTWKQKKKLNKVKSYLLYDLNILSWLNLQKSRLSYFSQVNLPATRWKNGEKCFSV